jgi:maltose alpha-D-glucosyltransferase/alpha-amylase
MLNFWYQDAVIYELDVKVFQDGNSDGIGDFRGLIRRLPHIAGLGANCLWLQPFYPSPLKDDGYDISDYYAIDPRLGSFGDFVVFLSAARELGLRVITDLVVNHTSDQHPWFQSARRSKDSPYRDYYIWSKKQPREELPPAFPGPESGTWFYDNVAQSYFFHTFYHFQPDLNTANPAVREEIGKIISFWLQLGLSGFRVDAAPFLIEKLPGVPAGDANVFVSSEQDQTDDPYALLREMRRVLSWRRGDAIFLAEANVDSPRIPDFFGQSDDRMHMLFDFLLNQRLMLALVRQDAAPLAELIDNLPPLPTGAQWANFLRNHDELDLGRLSTAERQEVYDAFAPDPNMRVYDRGIRRRLAPMMNGDRRRIEMAHALLLSLPGTPVIRYGEEIGMGDDLALPERLSVRTPMQWSSAANGGFSDVSADKLFRPAISEGAYGYNKVNVAQQQADAASLLNRLERLVRVRKTCPEMSQGRIQVLDVDHPAAFAHRCERHDGAIIAVHNLSEHPVQVSIDTGASEDESERLTDLICERSNSDEVKQPIDLAEFGYRWMRVVGGKWRSR